MECKYKILVLIATKQMQTGKKVGVIRNELAQLVNLSYPHFNRLSRASKNSLEGFNNDRLRKIASYFNVKVEEVFNGEVTVKTTEKYQIT